MPGGTAVSPRAGAPASPPEGWGPAAPKNSATDLSLEPNSPGNLVQSTPCPGSPPSPRLMHRGAWAPRDVGRGVAGTIRSTGSVVYPGVKVKNPVKEQLMRLRQQKQQNQQLLENRTSENFPESENQHLLFHEKRHIDMHSHMDTPPCKRQCKEDQRWEPSEQIPEDVINLIIEHQPHSTCSEFVSPPCSKPPPRSLPSESRVSFSHPHETSPSCIIDFPNTQQVPWSKQFPQSNPTRATSGNLGWASDLVPPPSAPIILRVQHVEKQLDRIDGEQLFMKDGDGDTLLHVIVSGGQRAHAYALARRYASRNLLNQRDNSGSTPLHLAVLAEQELIVSDLLSLGARVDLGDNSGQTPMHLAAERGLVRVLKVLQKVCNEQGQFLDPNSINFVGQTPLLCAAEAHNRACRESSANGANVHLKENIMQSIKLLLGMYATATAQDKRNGRTVLHLAVQDGNQELVNFLMRLPVFPLLLNVQMYNCNTALHVAAGLAARSEKHAQLVTLLVAAGADMSIKNQDREVASQLLPPGMEVVGLRHQLKARRSAGLVTVAANSLGRK
uniref:NF-kappa-B inhibitor delta-like n=1 Tax=Myxine glutinosa TaxID=7769 RepID=UPI00358E0A9D